VGATVVVEGRADLQLGKLRDGPDCTRTDHPFFAFQPGESMAAPAPAYSNAQERFRSLIPSYIRDSSVAVIVYDITSGFSLDEAHARPHQLPQHDQVG
jgi:hypothetical protein